MATKYLLPCPCGKKLPVEISQAGQSVTCECGTSLVVPTMREIRQLEEAEPEAAPPGRQPAWGLGRGISFSVALVVMLASLAFMAFTLYGYLQLREFGTVEDEIRMSRERFEDLNAEQMFHFWQHFRDEGIGQHEMHLYLQIERRATQMWWTILATGFIGFVSLMVVCVLAISSARGRRRVNRRPARSPRAPR